MVVSLLMGVCFEQEKLRKWTNGRQDFQSHTVLEDEIESV
jgi:hypothetical protein